jgi:hypothetical protein
MPHLDKNDKPIDPSKQYITLGDVQYANNAIDMFNGFKTTLTQMIESMYP